MRSRNLPLAGALAVALLAGGCVSSSDIESLQGQLNEIQRQILQVQQQAPSKQEVSDLEASVGRQMETLLESEADMQVRLDELSTQIERLQSKLEDTNYRLAQLSQTIAATNQELQALRSSPLMTRPMVPGEGEGDGEDEAGQPARTAPGMVTSDPEQLYQSAYQDYLRGNYDLALREFQAYLDEFPDSELADNAVYWMGESYYRQRRFRQAIARFDQVLNRYPRSDKLPSAVLKKGYAHLELGERSQGVVQLQYVLREYPNSDEANLARERLRELGEG